MILGADQLITLRMRHRVPPLVTLRLTAGDWPSDAKPSFLSLSVDADFNLEDWRPLMGLNVIVHGPQGHKARVLSACHHLMEAKAASVLGYCTDRPTVDPQFLVFGDGDFAWLDRQLEGTLRG